MKLNLFSTMAWPIFTAAAGIPAVTCAIPAAAPPVQGPAWAGDAGWPKRPSYQNHKREARRRRNREMNRRRHTWA